MTGLPIGLRIAIVPRRGPRCTALCLVCCDAFTMRRAIAMLASAAEPIGFMCADCLPPEARVELEATRRALKAAAAAAAMKARVGP